MSAYCDTVTPTEIPRPIKMACIHCIETLSLMPLATFSHFVGLDIGIVVGVEQCKIHHYGAGLGFRGGKS